MIHKLWNAPDDSTEEDSLPTITQQDTAAQVAREAPPGHRSGARARLRFSGPVGSVGLGLGPAGFGKVGPGLV